jgi:hypothetical protein
VALLENPFKIKTMDSASWMLGMRITRDPKAHMYTIKLDQELYFANFKGLALKFLDFHGGPKIP